MSFKQPEKFIDFGLDLVNSEFLKFKIIMDGLKVDFFLMGGTLLGLYRDKSLIKHDNDIDIGLMEDIELEPLMKNLKTWAQKNNSQIQLNINQSTDI